jgi:16S rRNA (cytosine967-C5)-methyltransferase
MLEIEPDLQEVVAVDNAPERLNLLNSTLERLKLPATVMLGDATCPELWWDGELFDRILIDAPCSATGVIRRHPDIKLHRKAKDVEELIEQQALILTKLWPLLKPGGILIYATCSILPEENAGQVAHFLTTQSDASEWPIQDDWGTAQHTGRQILPGQHNMDGFYYARLRKYG